jgi:hypothetical protein
MYWQLAAGNSVHSCQPAPDHLKHPSAGLPNCLPVCLSLQGPTSSGKTSLVSYLAAQTGHTFVRINNHEQTDLQARHTASLTPTATWLMLLTYNSPSLVLAHSARLTCWHALESVAGHPSPCQLESHPNPQDAFLPSPCLLSAGVPRELCQ